MKKEKYEMITVNEYVKLLDSDVKYLDNDAKEIQANIEKYLLRIRRAQTNAKILEALLA
jgi:hypothetical protein